MSSATNESQSSNRVPVWAQAVAWVLGVLVCLAGMVDLIGNWDREVATIQLLILIVGPVLWMLPRQRKNAASPLKASSGNGQSSQAWAAALLVFVTSWLTCSLVGRDMQTLPPAYHDEYSYLFQAKSLPPQTTRARLRGEFIKRAQERRRDFTVDWVHLKLNDQAQRTVLCKDPFRAVDERVEKLIASM